MRLIDADAVLHEIGELKKSPWYNDDSYPRSHAVRKEAVEIVEYLCIKDAPTVDAVEVVRCRECKFANFDFPDHLEWVYCERHYMYSMADDFCSYGETEKGRKNNE